MIAPTIQPPLFGVQQAERTTDDYYTPAWVFDRMGVTFDLDVCAPPGGIPWVPASRFFTQEDDGLAQPWDGFVWMNPPYSATTPWVDRFIAHGNGVCLVPWAKSAWTCRLWAAADAIALPEAWFNFVSPVNNGSISTAVLFAAFGQRGIDAIGRLGKVRS